jgi:hypothetical protein
VFDCNGSLVPHRAVLQAAPDLSEKELKRLFTALDVDNTGSVDAQEFFAGVLQVALQPHQTRTLLEASFKSLDRWAAFLRISFGKLGAGRSVCCVHTTGVIQTVMVCCSLFKPQHCTLLMPKSPYKVCSTACTRC